MPPFLLPQSPIKVQKEFKTAESSPHFRAFKTPSTRITVIALFIVGTSVRVLGTAQTTQAKPGKAYRCSMDAERP